MLNVLANFLSVNSNEIEEISSDTFEHDGAEYRVIADHDIAEAVKEQITETLWAFNADFIKQYTPLDGIAGAEDMIATYTQDKCENANDAMLALVGDNLDDLVADAISTDGAGHFLSHYDGEEHEFDGHSIFRVS